MGIVASTHEAPALDLVDHFDLALGVPCLGGDVDPMHFDEIALVAPARFTPSRS
jgi:hypothetical protein